MNGYMMEYQGKRYATNADSLMEAEDKLEEHLEIAEFEFPCRTSQFDSLESLGDKTEVIFF